MEEEKLAKNNCKGEWKLENHVSPSDTKILIRNYMPTNLRSLTGWEDF